MMPNKYCTPMLKILQLVDLPLIFFLYSVEKGVPANPWIRRLKYARKKKNILI